MDHCGVLLLAHGTPDSLDQIPEYLSNVTGGRPLANEVVQEVQRRYMLVGPSPLTHISLEQARLLAERLQLPVYLGMRNWSPYIRDAVARMRRDGIRQAAVICLAPQNSRTSTGLYHKVAAAETAGSMAIEFVESWADHPDLAEAFRERLEPVWVEASRRAGHNAPIIFTAHSVPQTKPSADQQPGALKDHAASGDSDGYAAETMRTAANVAALLAPIGLEDEDWSCAFQSQGMSGGPWIGPAVEGTLSALRQKGHKTVVIQPVGFLADHVEILYDIDISFQRFAQKIGLELLRTPSLNDSPLLTTALADVARNAFKRLGNRAASAPTAGAHPA